MRDLTSIAGTRLALACLVVAFLAAPAVAGQDPAVYDPELAAGLGADDYGMRRYVMAFLKAGPERS